MVDTTKIRLALSHIDQPTAFRDTRYAIEIGRLMADEIDSLRKQLAEAKRRAIPWRDGPARGVNPDLGRGVIAEIDGDAVTHGHSNGHDFLATTGYRYEFRRITRYLYVSDLIPAEPEKAKVKS